MGFSDSYCMVTQITCLTENTVSTDMFLLLCVTSTHQQLHPQTTHVNETTGYCCIFVSFVNYTSTHPSEGKSLSSMYVCVDDNQTFVLHLDFKNLKLALI